MFIKGIAKKGQNTFDGIGIMTLQGEKLALPGETYEVSDSIGKGYLANYPTTFIEVLPGSPAHNNDKAMIKLEEIVNGLLQKVNILEGRLDAALSGEEYITGSEALEKNPEVAPEATGKGKKKNDEK